MSFGVLVKSLQITDIILILFSFFDNSKCLRNFSTLPSKNCFEMLSSGIRLPVLKKGIFQEKGLRVSKCELSEAYLLRAGIKSVTCFTLMLAVFSRV